MRLESEYQRLGTLAYLAAYDVHRAKVIGPGEPTTGTPRRGTAAAGRTGLAQCEPWPPVMPDPPDRCKCT
jgi:hypothetical protein